jgi:peptide/nickel transport system permease protein
VLKLLLSRIGATLAVLLAVSALVFALGSLIPGDLTSVIVGQEGATPEQFEKVRRDLGLDQPLPVQYARWLWNAVQGDLGTSPITGRHISADLAHQIPVSVELALLCLLLSTAIGLPFGMMAAVHANGRIDVVLRSVLLCRCSCSASCCCWSGRASSRACSRSPMHPGRKARACICDRWQCRC